MAYVHKDNWQYRDEISPEELQRLDDGIQESMDTESADNEAVNKSLDELNSDIQSEAKTREEEDAAIRSEMQSGLDEKVDKANVVNDLDVTDEGYVLDARVGAQIKEEIASGGTSDLITDVFMEQDSYSAGDYCIYNNVLYKFTADKEPGEWDDSVVEATTVGAEITSNTDLIDKLDSDIADKQSALSVSTVSVDNQTISSGGSLDITADASKSGYTPLGIVGYRIYNASSSGTLCSWYFAYTVRISGDRTQCLINVRNTYSSQAKIAVDLFVLYAKN